MLLRGLCCVLIGEFAGSYVRHDRYDVIVVLT
jgi:hypothetical protein